MISDQQLAIREREIAKLFHSLQTATYERSGLPAALWRMDDAVPSPAQRIEQILRRAEEERDDGRGVRPVDRPSGSVPPRKASD